jgi:hypothetical protein
MKVKYIGVSCYRPDLGKLFNGKVMEVSDEMGNQLVADRRNWENLGVVARVGYAVEVKATQKSEVKKEDKKMRNIGLEQQAFVEEASKHHKGGEQ